LCKQQGCLPVTSDAKLASWQSLQKPGADIDAFAPLVVSSVAGDEEKMGAFDIRMPVVFLVRGGPLECG